MPTDTAAGLQAIAVIEVRKLQGAGQATGQDAHRATQAPPHDYGLESVTRGAARAAAFFLPLPGVPGPTFTTTDWHFHECQLQLAIVLRGQIDIWFAADRPQRVQAGELMVIPGGVPHLASNPSPDYSVLELTLPAGFTTVPCEAPSREGSRSGCVARLSASAARTPEGWSAGHYNRPDPITDDVWVSGFQYGTGEHQLAPGLGRTGILIVTAGSCVARAPGREQHRLNSFDALVIDAAEAAIAEATEDFAAVLVNLPTQTSKA